MNLENDLFLRALRGETVERPPVWMMRQAGRYLPEYMVLKEKYSFLERMKTPELACEITLQPIDIIKPDVAIIFSDIMTIPEALNVGFSMHAGKGPVIDNPIKTPQSALKIKAEDISNKLKYVYDAIALTKKELNGRVPLIGFSGAPWTLFCYMVEGQGSKTFSEAKEFLYKYPKESQHLLEQISIAIIEYLNSQIKSGADAVQIFDSWGGLLSKEDFEKWSLPYISMITKDIDKGTPVIVFAKGVWYSLEEIQRETSANALGLDWTIDAKFARSKTKNQITLQGNLDPSILLGNEDFIVKSTEKMLREFGKDRYIANLGHGMMPNIPVENAKLFINTIKNYKF